MCVTRLRELQGGNTEAGITGCARPETQLSASAVTIELPPRQLAVALGRQAAKQAAVAQASGDRALPPAGAPRPCTSPLNTIAGAGLNSHECPDPMTAVRRDVKTALRQATCQGS